MVDIPAMTGSADIDKGLGSFAIAHFAENNAIHPHAHAGANGLRRADAARSFGVRFAREERAHEGAPQHQLMRIFNDQNGFIPPECARPAL